MWFTPLGRPNRPPCLPQRAAGSLLRLRQNKTRFLTLGDQEEP
jgi:hypothetical protein